MKFKSIVGGLSWRCLRNQIPHLSMLLASVAMRALLKGWPCLRGRCAARADDAVGWRCRGIDWAGSFVGRQVADLFWRRRSSHPFVAGVFPVAPITKPHTHQHVRWPCYAECVSGVSQVDTGAMDPTILAGGQELEPFEAQLEGGKNGPFYQEMVDYFYYAQLRAQGKS